MFKTKSRLCLALMTLQMLSNICLTIGFSTRKKNSTFEFIETDPYEPVMSKLSISPLTTNSTSAPTENSTVANTNTLFQYKDITSWNSDYPACKGQKQSPIALDSKDVLLDQKSPLHWNGYDILPSEMTLSNSGPTLKLVAKWEADKIPFISGGPLVDEYIFGQLHFHWGNNDKSGAEHSIHGQTFPLEMHILHYNKKYGSVGNATQHVDGIAVVAVLFSIKSQNTSVSLDPIVDYIPFVVKEKTSVDITPFQLSTLAGVYSPMAFMSYFGSLTTPPCSEVVTWIIPIYSWPVTKLQLSKFRTLKSSQLKLKANNRPRQPLNGRQVYFYNS